MNPTLVKRLIATALLVCLMLSNDCRSDVGIAAPAFISSAAIPNLLILVDNSASMADLAHTGRNSGGCHDDPDTETFERYDSLMINGLGNWLQGISLGKVYRNAAVLTYIRTDCPLKVFSIDHLEPTDRRMVVTAAE